jgi:uncharacterized damage-inducible protein DinB
VEIYDTDAGETFAMPLGQQLAVFLGEHRQALRACLEGLSEEQARQRLVSSATTLLGLVKHATFVEQVWFGEAISGRSRAELGIVDGPDESFQLDADDTIASVVQRFDSVCEQSDASLAGRSIDDVVTGNRRGPLPLRWIILHVIREHAQHSGHADILREQLLLGR